MGKGRGERGEGTGDRGSGTFALLPEIQANGDKRRKSRIGVMVTSKEHFPSIGTATLSTELGNLHSFLPVYGK